MGVYRIDFPLEPVSSGQLMKSLPCWINVRDQVVAPWKEYCVVLSGNVLDNLDLAHTQVCTVLKLKKNSLKHIQYSM